MLPSLLFTEILLLCLLSGLTSASESELQILLDIKQTLTFPPGFESWNSNNSPCNFSGVTCAAGSVSSIDLTGIGLVGPLPLDSLCHLPALSKLALSNNDLSGPITPSLSNCTSLLYLDLSYNALSSIDADLSFLTKIQILNISDNSLTGVFPWDLLANLTNLQVLSLGDNPFDPSPFPAIVTNLPKLYVLYLSGTNLQGQIPPEIGNLTELVDLELSVNSLSGGIPPEICNLQKLQTLELYNSSLTGTIPTCFGNLTNLQFFDASMNWLEGNLSELRYLNNLISLQLFYNNLSGEIPPEFGEFKHFVNISLYSNNLSGELPQRLASWSEFDFIDISTNFFTGRIPPDMCRMGTMRKLLVLENQFTGEIPATYANCSTLLRFRVSNNSLTGTVPAGIWSLPKVNIIDLEANQLEGPVTAGIGAAKSLYQLYLANNRFSGELPAEISGASSLVEIDAGYNNFSGRIPANIGELKSLTSLNLKKNSITGEIPDSLGSCAALSAVSLASNSLTGSIPASLGELQRLNSLDLSANQLTGEIPASMASLKLSSLNLSYNPLTGPVPLAFSTGAYAQSFLSCPDLCSNGNDNDISYLRQCVPSDGHSSDKLRTLLVCFLAAFALLLASLGILTVLRRRQRQHASDIRHARFKDSWDLKSFRVLTFDEQEIIASVRHENLIGKGGSGNVYRVDLGSGKVVAVKHIWNSAAHCGSDGGWSAVAVLTRRSSSIRSKEFEAEIATLSAIRHVNVVKLFCSITNEDSNLLVYEYLNNGSLWDRLHGPAAEKLGLDWESRYEIAVGSARGLEYLHHGCDRPILHRDVKSSNILLDECLKPRIADFGLAKILHGGGGGGGGGAEESMTHVVAGTHGYIAPEYAYTWRVNEKSDVYSFGVVLLELVTGRRPIEAEYGENKDIVDWISENLTSKESVMGVVDERFNEAEREKAVKVLRVAVSCTARLPTTRPTMRKVMQMLVAVGGDRVLDARNKKVEMDGDCYKIGMDNLEKL